MEHIVTGDLNYLTEQIEEHLEEIVNDDYVDEYLDDVYGDVEIFGTFYDTSYLLKELDSIAYRCMQSDLLDNELSNTLYDLECDGMVGLDDTTYILEEGQTNESTL